MSKSSDQEWLPLPKGISSSPHNSFTQYLLCQFDKKSTQIFEGVDLGSMDQNSSRSRINLNPSPNGSGLKSMSRFSSLETEERPHKRSPGNLLKKSSLFLKNKFSDHIKHPPQPSLFHSWSLHPKSKRTPKDSLKITTPPIITQYPPKPLKYSPVEPLQDEDFRSHHAGTLHRISLPLLKLTSERGTRLDRRRSDSDLLKRQAIDKSSTSVLHSLGKHWNKLFCTCKHKKKKDMA